MCLYIMYTCVNKNIYIYIYKDIYIYIYHNTKATSNT